MSKAFLLCCCCCCFPSAARSIIQGAVPKLHQRGACSFFFSSPLNISGGKRACLCDNKQLAAGRAQNERAAVQIDSPAQNKPSEKRRRRKGGNLPQRGVEGGQRWRGYRWVDASRAQLKMAFEELWGSLPFIVSANELFMFLCILHAV